MTNDHSQGVFSTINVIDIHINNLYKCRMGRDNQEWGRREKYSIRW